MDLRLKYYGRQRNKQQESTKNQSQYRRENCQKYYEKFNDGNGEIKLFHFCSFSSSTYLTIKPMKLTPPFVPLGTRFRVVIKNGSDPVTEPISLAHVSPLQQANADITAIPSQLGRY